MTSGSRRSISKSATAIFPNSDIKHDSNKTRALCTLWQKISYRRKRFGSALAWRRRSHGFRATTVNAEISYGTLPLIHKMPVGFIISFAFSPQLGSCPKTRHFQGGMSGVVVISRRRPCAACKSRFLLKRCPFCCPPGVNKDHRKISEPRM